jgi:hypothetical protein
MSHEPFCPLVKGCQCPWYSGTCDNCDCVCELIKQSRAYERSLTIDNGREGITP